MTTSTPPCLLAAVYDRRPITYIVYHSVYAGALGRGTRGGFPLQLSRNARQSGAALRQQIIQGLTTTLARLCGGAQRAQRLPACSAGKERRAD